MRFPSAIYRRWALIIYLFSILINIGFVIFVFTGLTENQIYTYFNSDTLYLHSIYKDIFLDKSGISGWHLNAAPNFFPDMIFFFIFHKIFSDFILASLIYSIAQYLIILLLFYHLFRFVFRGLSLNYLSAANFLMLLFFAVTIIDNDFVFTFYLLSISYHLGAFINALICLIFTFKYLNLEKKYYLVMLFVFGFLGTISDRLFLVLYTVPVFAFTVFLFINEYRQKVFKVLTINLACFLSGYSMFLLIKNSGFIHIIGTKGKIFNFENIGDSFHIMIGQYKYYLSSLDYRALIVLLTIFSFLILTCILVIQLRKILKQRSIDIQFFMESGYVLFSVVFIVIVMFTPVINGNYYSPAILRYNIYYIYLGIFNYAYIFYYLSRNKIFNRVFNPVILIVSVYLVVCLISYIKNHEIRKGMTNFLNYYPGIARCVDEIAEKHNLKYGVAHYWNAKLTTMFSRKDIRVYTVHHDMAIWYHVTNQNWYYKNGKGRYSEPEFNFVITNDLDSLAITNLLGKPEEILRCGDIEILKFDKYEFDRNTRKPIVK
jgi:hypothetical protein